MNIKWITESQWWLYSKTISNLKKQLIKFVLIGLTAVMVDLTCYYLFLTIFPEHIFSLTNEAFAKALSFLCGMGVTYFFNKHWTWRQTNHSKVRAFKFALLYGTSLIVNVTVNSTLIYVLHNYDLFEPIPLKYLVAFIGATGVSSIINFIGQKFWVFKIGHF